MGVVSMDVREVHPSRNPSPIVSTKGNADRSRESREVQPPRNPWGRDRTCVPLRDAGGVVVVDAVWDDDDDAGGDGWPDVGDVEFGDSGSGDTDDSGSALDTEEQLCLLVGNAINSNIGHPSQKCFPMCESIWESCM